ncbi:MAG: hypothetical protein IJR88_03140 [Clostridia bacterium]|nr:hypothetical protein [Clostridia bacterium]
MKNFKRVFAALLAVVMILTMLPMAAIADDTDDSPWLQVESSTDPQTGKSTLKIKLNMDKIKKGKISGISSDDLFAAVLGTKEVANSGIISMEDLLKIFPIVYEVDDETGSATNSQYSVLDVVGTTAIIGISTIVEEYVDDLGQLIEDNQETLKDEIYMQNVLDEVQTNPTLKKILASYLDSEEERDLYLTDAGKAALQGVAGKTKEDVLASLTAEDFIALFNNGYLNFQKIVEDLLADILEAIEKKAEPDDPDFNDYLKNAGQNYVEAHKLDIIKYLLENQKITVQDLYGYLILNADNAKAILGENEKDNFANYILSYCIQEGYVQEGKAAELAQAIREEKSLQELMQYLNVATILEEGFGLTENDILEKAIARAVTAGLVVEGTENDLLAFIQSGNATIEEISGCLNIDPVVDAMNIELDDDAKQRIQTDLDNIVIDENDNGSNLDEKMTVAGMIMNGSPVSAILPYVDAVRLLEAIYGDDVEAANAAIKVLLASTNFVLAGGEDAVLDYLRGDAEMDAAAASLQVEELLGAFNYDLTDLYEVLLKSEIVKVSIINNQPRKREAAEILEAYIASTDPNKFESLIEQIDATPFKEDLLATIVIGFLEEIENGDVDRKNAFVQHVAALIEDAPSTYITPEGIETLFGANLIYYFFNNVDPATGKIDGYNVADLLNLDNVIALLDVELADGETIKEKLVSEYGYNNYLTDAGREFIQSKVVEAVAGKTIEDLYANYETYFKTDVFFNAIFVTENEKAEHIFDGKKFTDIIFEHPQRYMTTKGMNTILQYWLTVEGVDGEDFSNIITALQNAPVKKYDTTEIDDNGNPVQTEDELDGKKILRSFIINMIDNLFQNGVDLVIGEQDIADTVASTGSNPNDLRVARNLVIDGTALLERIYNVILPTLEEVEEIDEETGFVKSFNIIYRALPDRYYWGETTGLVPTKAYIPHDGGATTKPSGNDSGEPDYITVDVDVEIYLTGNLNNIKRLTEKYREDIEHDIDFDYIYDYEYDGVYGETNDYGLLTAEKRNRTNRYNKVNVVMGDDEIDLALDLPYVLNFVYKNLAESELDPEIKEKLYRFVYEKTPEDLTNENFFTKEELDAMIDALDLDAVLADFWNDVYDENDPNPGATGRGRKFIMLLFDFIGYEDQIAEWYENGEETTAYYDAEHDRTLYYVNPEWTEENGWYVNAEWIWQGLAHWKDLEQALVSRGSSLDTLAGILETIRKNKITSKNLKEYTRNTDFAEMVDRNKYEYVGTFLSEAVLAFNKDATELSAALLDQNNSFKDVLHAIVHDEYENIQKHLRTSFEKFPEAILTSAFSDFYVGDSFFQSEPEDSSQSTYVTLDENKLINEGLKKALASAGLSLEEEDIAKIVDGFIGNLSESRLVVVSATQNGLYKAIFHKVDGSEQLVTFLPMGTNLDPNADNREIAYVDTEEVTGYVFAGWSLDPPSADAEQEPIDAITSYDADYYPIFAPDYTIEYNVNVTFVAPEGDQTQVSGDLLSPDTYHYEDDVTIEVGNFTDGYMLKEIKYLIPGEPAATVYTPGSTFPMPMGDLEVTVYLKTTEMEFEPEWEPDGVEGTVEPASEGEPIVIEVTTPGREVEEVEYDGKTYRPDDDGVLRDIENDDPNTNQLVAVEDVTEIVIRTKLSEYHITKTVVALDGNPNATASLEGITANSTFHYGDQVELVPAGVTNGYAVDHFEYSTDGVNFNVVNADNVFEMPAGDVIVKIVLEAVNVPTYTISTTFVSDDDATVSGTAHVATTIYQSGFQLSIGADHFTPGYKLDYIEYSIDGGNSQNYTIGDEITLFGGDVEVIIHLTKINYTLTLVDVVEGNNSLGAIASLTCPTTGYHYGSTVTLTATDTESIGYKLKGFKYSVDGVNYTEVVADNAGNYQFTIEGTDFTVDSPNFSDEIKVKIVLEQKDYTVTCVTVVDTNGAQKSASLTNATTGYHYGDSVTLSATGFDTGYELDHFEYRTVGGSYQTVSKATNTFSMPAANVEVKIVVKQTNYTLTLAEVVDTDGAQKSASLTNAETGYHYGDMITLGANITSTGYKLDHFEYRKVGANNYTQVSTTTNRFSMPAGNVEVKIVLKQIDYTIYPSFVSDDGRAVSGNFIPGTSKHYGDNVTIEVDNLTEYYELDYVEYRFASEEDFTQGNSFEMPNENVYVVIHLTRPEVELNPIWPEDIEGTINQPPVKAGDPIKVKVTTPGYEVDTVIYDGTVYTFKGGKLVDGSGNGPVAKKGVSELTITARLIQYTVHVEYSVSGVFGSLSDMTVDVEDIVDLTVESLNTEEYIVDHVGYYSEKDYEEKTYTEPLKMIDFACDLYVTVYVVKPTTPVVSTYSVDGIEVLHEEDNTPGEANVSVDKEVYEAGQTVTITVDEIEEGYEFDSIVVVVNDQMTKLEGNSFEMPASNVGVIVYIRRQTYNYTIAGKPGQGLYKETVTFTIELEPDEFLKTAPEGCALINSYVGEDGSMELTYALLLSKNNISVDYEVETISYSAVKVYNGIEWGKKEDPTDKGSAVFNGWSKEVGIYSFAIFSHNETKANLLWLWILLAILALLILLQTILYRKDEKDGREKGGFWKVIRGIGDAWTGLCKKFYGIFHKVD